MSLTSRARSRCSSTCPTRRTPSPRWPAAPSAICWCRFPGSRCGGCSTWRAARTGRRSATHRATSTTGPGARSSSSSRDTARSSRCARRSPGRCCLSDSEPPSGGTLAKRDTDAPSRGQRLSGYGSGARILSIGIASTGLLTFAYFSIASHVLGEESAKLLDVLWSVMFVIISVIYRPIEQLLSRTIAERRAVGSAEHGLRVPILIQASFALIFLVVAVALRSELVNDVFEGESALYYV